ncbi:helix-turn-helix domain-containing protein [Streptomyces sp. SID9727]|uniref:helix-turn-helix domain-containing protein n=1 Tax=Streptomyces sp. SID9727 TaxID=2706114 RepID=UPI0013CC24A5|nr:helix-turn-helix domain-containing protein [Streptomyces sp. SID9727]NEC67446.1 helix-turn-helix domain-containing protein [Streptomyces sp. SID9727]
MTAQQAIAPPCAPPGSPGAPSDVTPTSGVIHVNSRHTSGFTVIGNHLAQHGGLSLLAIGLAVHIQSLPEGAKIGVKVLAARLPESEMRIAAALRELEAAGYLRRTRVRLRDGRVRTRTESHNRPYGTALMPPVPYGAPRATTPPPTPSYDRPGGAAPTPPPAKPGTEPKPGAAPAPRPLPQPRTDAQNRTAARLLADLRRHAPALTLSGADIAVLTPGVAAWLERDAHPDAIRRALTADLPVPLAHPARLLRHRITALLPPPLPAPAAAPAVIPLQNCDGCNRAFRAPEPGACRECRTGGFQ